MNPRHLFFFTIVLIVLKLLNGITWNWFWVLAPLLIPIIIILLTCVFLKLICPTITLKEVLRLFKLK